MAVVACEVQVAAWIDTATPDKHQRRSTPPPRTNIKGACTIVFALAEVWVMRLEKLPFVVVLLVGRVNPLK